MRRRTRPLQLRMAADSLAGRGGIDILLTHAPCRGYGDMEDIPHRGFKCFNYLLKTYRPKFHCFGHVHREYGHFKRTTDHPSGTVLVNACGYYIYEI